MPISLVLADDHPLVLDGLESLFRTDGDFRILERCSNGDEAILAVHRHRPDVLLLDVRLRQRTGSRCSRVQDQKPTGWYSAAALDEAAVADALRLGARGRVEGDAAHYLIECIRKACGRAVDRTPVSGPRHRPTDPSRAGEREVAVLTPREVEVVVLVARGLHNGAIADRLAISEGTVKVHLHKIYEKLQLDDRVALVLYARSKNLT